MPLLRRREPAPQHDKYTEYKVYLREDFVYRCVYCTVHENEWGGPRHFDVEHFRPKSSERFVHLITDYRNLLYACDVCNTFKSNDWPSDDPIVEGIGYLDPCEHDYDEHFVLTDDYELLGKSLAANYMKERLHLNRRQLKKLRKKRTKFEAKHQEILSQLDTLIATLEKALKESSLSVAVQEELQRAYQLAQSQRIDQMQEWEARWIPQVSLEDYR